MSQPHQARVFPLLIAALVAGLLAAPAGAQTPRQSCNDRVPTNCARAQFLGEDKGCACFVCNSDKRATRKVVCTREDADKRALFKLVPTSSARSAPATDATATGR